MELIDITDYIAELIEELHQAEDEYSMDRGTLANVLMQNNGFLEGTTYFQTNNEVIH